MLSEHETKLLCETNAGTPMGELFRRFWMPVLLSEELPRPDSDPVAIRILGEDLVAFRDSEGKVGLVEARCPHRAANLFWGRNEECGLRCTYHGWKFNTKGDCLDMPNEPPENNFKDRIQLTAYPTREIGACIWAYMGPKNLEPPDVPQIEWVRLPSSHYVITKRLQETNWAHATEGGLDNSHVTYLHSSAERQPDNFGPDRVSPVRQYMSTMFSQPTVYGFITGSRNEAPENKYNWSLQPFLLPSAKLIRRPATNRATTGFHFWVPVDDQNCWDFCVSFDSDQPLTPEQRARLDGGSETIPNNIHALVDKHSSRWDLHLSNAYQPLTNLRNNYNIDREEQRTSTFTGIKGFSEQDFAIQESQGRISPRWKEHLGTSDLRIIEFRKLMLNLARDLLEGKEPEAPQNPRAYAVRESAVTLSRDIPPEVVLSGEYGRATAKA